MASKSIYRVVIQHITGAKANQIEQFPLAEKTKLSLGCDPASDITFDSVRDTWSVGTTPRLKSTTGSKFRFDC